MTPTEQRLQLYKEMFQDKTRIKFITTVLNTYDASQRRSVRFNVFPKQKEFLKALSEYDNNIAIKPRQSGISTLVAGWTCGQMVFASKKSPECALYIANKLEQAELLLKKLTDFIDQIPRWMWGPDYYDPDPNDPKNLKSIYTKKNKKEFELFNGSSAYARSSGPSAARGISAVSILVLDECAFINDSQVVYSQALATTSSVDHAKVILVSTPNGKDQLYYKTYHQAITGENSFHPVEFRWFHDPRYNKYLEWRKLNKETGIEMVQKDPIISSDGTVTFNEEKWNLLVKDKWKPWSPWYQSMRLKYSNDSIRIAQELDVSFLGSSDNVIPPESIDFQSKQNVVKITKDWPLHDTLEKETWIWADPNPNHQYIMSVDVGSGESADSSAIEIIDITEWKESNELYPYQTQVLEFLGKRTATDLTNLVYRYAKMYYEPLVTIDCVGGYGNPVSELLENMKYPNIFKDTPAMKNYMSSDTKNGYIEDGKAPGFRTNSVRYPMLAEFAEAINNNSFRIKSERVINELDTWVWKNGRQDHMTGYHDDAIYALAMGLFVMKYYLFRKIDNKERAEAILHSFKTNKAYIYDTEANKIKDKIDINEHKRPMPFFTQHVGSADYENRIHRQLIGNPKYWKK